MTKANRAINKKRGKVLDGILGVRIARKKKLMTSETENLLDNALYVVATPIGNLGDITLRAVETLKSANVVACEDTRVTRILLNHFAIKTRVIAVHEHNERNAADGIVNLLQHGRSVALVTDAGTPAVSDPGAVVVNAVRVAGFRVIPIPGASAVIAAISASGEGEHGFTFAGFLPTGAGDRKRALESWKTSPHALVFYESPHRIVDMVTALRDAFGEEREIVLLREITKKFENIHRVKLRDATAWLEADNNNSRGEFVVIVANASTGAAHEVQMAQEQELERTLTILCEELPLKQAVALAVKLTGEKKNKVYDLALALKASPENP